MAGLQEAIHKLETGGGPRGVRFGVGVLVLGLLVFLYNWRGFHTLSNPEAMDAAQLARNLAQGKGYTTSCIRPWSMHLLKARDEQLHGPPAPGAPADSSRLKRPHPDLANPPAYPVVLAGLMKVLPFRYEMRASPSPFWNPGGIFRRYQPDFVIALFNQLLFFTAATALFFFARRYFDPAVAWLSTLVFLGTELLWRFSMSGLPTLLLLLIFMGLAWCLALFEEESRQPRFGQSGLYLLAAGAGLLTGIGALTLYSFAWVAIPAVALITWLAPRRRWLLGGVAFASFAVVLGPWVARNLALCGAPFGVAGYSLAANFAFPEFRLERSLDPQSHIAWLDVIRGKLLTGGRQMLTGDLPRLGGTWLSAFFLAGLLLSFRNSTVRRLRLFLVAALLCLFAAQALGRTHLTEDSPEVTSENLLVVLAPLVILYGVSLFFTLLEARQVLSSRLRSLIVAAFAVVACLPFLLSFVGPRTPTVPWPPYNPPAIQLASGWLKPGELMMSDIPWAVAWYGQRSCVWLTLNADEDFLAINDYQKAINAVYLSPVTLDRKFGSETIGLYTLTDEISGKKEIKVAGADLHGWSGLLVEFYASGLKVPPWFPLRSVAPIGSPTRHLLLTDWERWPKPAR